MADDYHSLFMETKAQAKERRRSPIISKWGRTVKPDGKGSRIRGEGSKFEAY